MMISSVSGCVPNSRIRVSFVSSKNQLFDITTDVLVYVGIALKVTRPINLLQDDQVEIEIDTPPGYLGYQFYEYILDDEQNAFAVVNRNDYRPTVKPNDAPRKWFNYFPRDIRTSFYETSGTTLSRPLGRGRNFVDIDVTHVVLDHTKEQIHFFSPNRELVTSVQLPSGPVEYKKSTYVDNDGNTRVEVFVICNDKRLYRVRFDNQFSESSEFFPTITFIRSLELIWYEADLPTGESYLDNRRNSLRSKVNPPMTALEVIGNVIWVGGYDTVYILNKNFQTLTTIRIGTESIVSIACLDQNTAYAVTRTGKIYQVLATGTYNMFYDAERPLGVPATFEVPGQAPFILVPDPNYQRLLKIVGPVAPVIAESWFTPDHAPAYARVFDGELFVTSHDSNEVLRYTDKNTRYIYEFSDKVTIVSWVQDKTNHTLLAIHYLEDYVTLELTGIEKIIPINLGSLKGPLTQIGSKPVKLIMLGQEGILPHAGPGITCWVNGIKDEPASTGDNFGISYKASGAGFVKTAFVIGDRAYDIDIEVVGDDSYLRSFNTGAVAVNEISTLANVATISTPTVGNIQTGTTSLNLGLNLNFFGNLYTQINVSTNGYVSFGTNIRTGVTTTVGGLDVDALYIEPKDLYQGLAINNTNPTNITFPPLQSGQVPAVYYASGSQSGYKYARIRWVGINGNPDPTGNNINLVTSIVNSPDIPVPTSEFSKATRFDYVSGNGITSATQVTGTYVTPLFDFSIYKFRPGNQILVTSYNSNVISVARYSRINALPVYVTAKNYSLKVNTGFRSNYLIDLYGNTAVIDGSIDPAVDIDWAIRIPRFGGVPNYIYQTGITSIVETTDTITCLGVYTEFDGNGIVSNVYPESMFVSSTDFDSVIVDQNLSGIPAGPAHVVSKLIVGNSYVINTSIVHLLNPGDTFTVTKTTVTTATNMPTLAEGASLSLTVGFEYSSLTVTSMAGIQLGPIIVRGSFIVVNPPVTANIGTTLTFSSSVAAQDYSYEVGFYQNNKHQFIEYFYDNVNHSTTTGIGMATGARRLGKRLLSNVAPSASSIVYYSEIGTGIFRSLGIGSFDFVDEVDVIAPRFSKGIIKSDYDYTVEFYVEQDITTTSNIYLASTFGLLQLNGSQYTTTNPIKKNDLVQLTVPFNRSLRAVAPIVSLGTNQFPVPMIASAAIGTLIEHRFLTANLATSIIIPITITIPASDYYYIPDLYRSGGGILADFQYSILRGGNTILLQSGGTYDLFAGDQLTVSGIATSGILYDTRDVVLIGQTNAVIITAETAGPGLVNQLSFSTVIEPYVNNYYYNFSNITDVYVEEFSGYTTENLVLTSNSNITTANLFIGDVDTKFVINGVVAGSYVSNVPLGSNIAIYRKFIDYFQSNVVVYQVEYDTTVSSNVYIPVGIWNVENRIIIGGKFVQSTTLATAIDSSLESVTMFDSNLGISPELSQLAQFGNSKLLPITSRPFSYETGKLSVDTFFGTYETFRIVSNFIISSATYVVPTGSVVFSPDSHIRINQIASSFIDVGSYNFIDTIRSKFITPLLFTVGQIYSSYFEGYSELYVDKIRSDIDVDTVFIAKSSTSDFFDSFSFLNGNIQEDNISLPSYTTGSILNKLDTLITYLRSEIQEDNEKSFSVNFVDKFQAEVAALSAELFDQIHSELSTTVSYLTDAMTSNGEQLTSYVTEKMESANEQVISLLYSKITELEESNPSYLTDRMQSDTYKIIQEIFSIIQRKNQAVHTEFWSRYQSIYETEAGTFDFSHESMVQVLSTQLPFMLTSESETNYNESINLIGVDRAYQSWSEVPQFEFERNEPYAEHAFEYQIEIDYANLLFFGQDNTELLEQPTNPEVAYPFEKLDSPDTLNLPILPKHDIVPRILVPFVPMRDLPPVYFIPFTPLLDSPPETLIPLDVMLDIVPELIIPFDPILFQEINWEMENIIPEVGAVSTYAHYWADQGRFNDKWNLREFNSTNYTRAYDPLVLYTKQYTYGPGGFYNDGDAEDEKVKYYNAGILQIPGTDFWNYRIYFKDRHFCVPRKGRVFPVTWYIRGG